MPATGNDKPNAEHDIRLTDSCRTDDENWIAREVKSAVKELLVKEFSSMIKEWPYNILRKLLHNAQSGIRSVEYNTVEQVMWDLQCENIFREILGTHPSELFDTNAAANMLSKRLLTSITIMAPIATCARRKTDTAMEQKKCSTAFAMKDTIYTAEPCHEVDESSPSHSGCVSDKQLCRESSKCCLKRYNRKRESKAAKRHSSSSELSLDKYGSRSELKSADENLSTHVRHGCYRRVLDSKRYSGSPIDRHERSRCHYGQEFPVVRSGNDHFEEVLDYKTYCLADKLYFYDYK